VLPSVLQLGIASCDIEKVLMASSQELVSGNIVGIPTDTVYGLAASLYKPNAINDLFRLKARPADVAMPVLVADTEQAFDLAEFSPWGERLAKHFWPGPLTLVLQRKSNVKMNLGGDFNSIGLRCQNHDFIRKLCRLVGPLVTTSANLHGGKPFVDVKSFLLGVTKWDKSDAELGKMMDNRGSLSLIIDGGVCNGKPSNVVDCRSDEPLCIRQGAIPWDAVMSLK
jgi:L-threonylcarbamoyladenylate synthase